MKSADEPQSGRVKNTVVQQVYERCLVKHSLCTCKNEMTTIWTRYTLWRSQEVEAVIGADRQVGDVREIGSHHKD